MKKKKKSEFSKFLLIQESVLIWIITLAFIGLAFFCVINQYFGELPWLTAMVGLPWTAYGVSQACYYKKAERENTKGGIKYDTTMYALDTNDNEEETAVG
jgi:hypothetical protein